MHMSALFPDILSDFDSCSNRHTWIRCAHVLLDSSTRRWHKKYQEHSAFWVQKAGGTIASGPFCARSLPQNCTHFSVSTRVIINLLSYKLKLYTPKFGLVIIIIIRFSNNAQSQIIYLKILISGILLCEKGG